MQTSPLTAAATRVAHAFDGSANVFAESVLKPGDSFVTNPGALLTIGEGEQAIKLPWHNVSMQVTGATPNELSWTERLTEPIPGAINDFTADVMLKQDGANLGVTVKSVTNGFPTEASTSYQILAADREKLVLLDAVTGQQNVTTMSNFDPKAMVSGGKIADTTFSWSLPTVEGAPPMRVDKTGSFVRPPAE